MAKFFKTSTLWVVDFQHDGRTRRWFKAFGPTDGGVRLAAALRDLYGDRAQGAAVRKATDQEELQYLRDRRTASR